MNLKKELKEKGYDEILLNIMPWDYFTSPTSNANCS